jgi:hypothetical protein
MFSKPLYMVIESMPAEKVIWKDGEEWHEYQSQPFIAVCHSCGRPTAAALLYDEYPNHIGTKNGDFTEAGFICAECRLAPTV